MIIFEQSITINADPKAVESCLTDLTVMHCWLNPLLKCEPVGVWGTEVGDKSRFVIQIPLIQPSLESIVLERESGLIVWGFDGFFQGCDRWQWHPTSTGTHLLNRFEFEIPNPLVKTGFQLVAATLTKRDMTAQLKRIKSVAELLNLS